VGFARAAGIETHVIRERHRFDLAVLSQLRQITSDVNPDIIQTHNNKSHLLLRLLPGSRARRLWFAFHHGDTYPDLKQRVYNRIDGVTLRAADRVVTLCEAFRPRLIAWGVSSDRVRILHNAASPVPPVSQAERAQLRERLGLRCGEAVILSIGRLFDARASTRAADRSHLPARRAAAEESVATIGFEPGHVHSRWHVDLLQHLARLGINSPQVALAAFQGGVPELSIDPGDAGHEAVGFDRAQNLACLRVDLMDLPITILSDPQRPLGPCEPRVAATAGCRDGGEDLSRGRIDLLDAILRDLK